MISKQGVTCKLLLVGPPGVGKSALLQAYNGAEFDNYSVYKQNAPNKPSKSGGGHNIFSVKDVKCGDVDVCLQVWDLGGNATGKTLLRGSNAVVLVVDLTSLASLEKLDEIYDRVRIFAGFVDDNFPCVLVGNKLDEIIKREVTMDHLGRWAQSKRPLNLQNGSI